MAAFITRFAPSPTGLLHRGHAYAALTAWSAAREAGGDCLLRIEDTDFTRCRPAFEQAIYDDLAWLGLDWPEPVMRQSERRDLYDAALARLRALDVLYRCFSTRREAMGAVVGAPHRDDPVDAIAFTPQPPPADEEAERLARGDAFAWRLSLDCAEAALGGFRRLTWREHGEPCVADPRRLGDLVLGRKDIGAGYMIASVVDDAAQGVTCVVRGEDLLDVTHAQRVLQALLDLPTPDYRHHPLLTDASGRRLAKRTGGETLQALRERGVDPAELRAELGFTG